jgi:hypothetical protein
MALDGDSTCAPYLEIGTIASYQEAPSTEDLHNSNVPSYG